MKTHKKDDMKLVVALENGADFQSARLFDSVKHMEETIRTECGCYLSEKDRKKSVKLAKELGLPPTVASRAACYSAAKGLIECMQFQEVYIYQLDTLEAEFVSILEEPSTVKLYMVLGHISYLKKYGFNVNGVGGMVSNLAVAWKKHLAKEAIALQDETAKRCQKTPAPTPTYTGPGAGVVNNAPIEETLSKAGPDQMFCIGGKWVRGGKTDHQS